GEDMRGVAERLGEVVKKGKGWNEAVVRAYPMTRQTAIAPFTAIVEKDMKSNIDEPERYYPEFIKKLRRLAADAENGKLSGNVRLIRHMREANIDIEPLWRKLAALCRQLESLAA